MKSPFLNPNLSPKNTPQSAPIPGRSDMTRNAAGGWHWDVDKWARLRRFLILGTTGGTFYVTEEKLTSENVDVVRACLKEDGRRVVREIREVSERGLAPKNDPALYALAMASALGDEPTKWAAHEALPKVARTATHLFHFVAFRRSLAGGGSGFRRAVQKWYLDRSPDSLANQLVKYQSRDGWSHRDVISLMRPKASGLKNAALRWAVRGDSAAYDFITKGTGARVERADAGELPALIAAFERAKRATTEREIISLIGEAKLPREAVPTLWLKSPAVWDALLPEMGMTALVRNLATMTRIGLLQSGSDAARRVAERLRDREAIRAGRLHPLQVGLASLTYTKGRGVRSDSTWVPVPRIQQALEDCFDASFESTAPIGGRWLVAVDVSGSMFWAQGCAGMELLVPGEAAALMAAWLIRAEEDVQPMAFAREFRPWPVTRRSSVSELIASIRATAMGATDCAMPMLWAKEQKLPVDHFVVLTDNETWCGGVHPSQALVQYRQAMGLKSGLLVQAMVSTQGTIADPKDPRMLDVVGASADMPLVYREFAEGAGK